MDIERQDRSRWHFALGPVERWIVGIVAASLIGGVVWFVSALLTKLDTQGLTLDTLSVQQAVTNSQLESLRLQLADVPGLSVRLARTEVRLQAAEEEIKELRRMKGLQ